MTKFKMSVSGNWYEIEIRDLNESPVSVLVDGELYRVELGPEVPDARVSEEVREELEVSTPKPTLEVSRPAFGQALRQDFGERRFAYGRAAQDAVQDAAAAGGEVIAPMPGKILAINVGEGDPVQHKEVLCTLEAMKMENEIMASAGGVVKEIRVIEGQDVLYGDILFVIES